jgi:glucose-1-phosphate cytidylyltransferase
LSAPGTIGSIVWLARNEAHVDRVRHGLVLGLLGDRGPLTYKRSRRGQADIDRIAAHALQRSGHASRLIDFSPYGYDERQLCSPGFNLPVGRLTRTPNNEYPQYHSSADDFSIVDRDCLAESLQACASILSIADRDERYVNLSPKCEPRLGKRGLYRLTGGAHPGEFEHALLWVLNQSDGSASLLDVAERSGLSFAAVAAAADALQSVELLSRRSRHNRGEPHESCSVLWWPGTRLREHSDTIPKPLVNVGYRPILWHLMRYFPLRSQEFILCLGYRGDMIREYFLNYNEAMTNDFVMSNGGRTIEYMSRDVDDWKITFVDTGMHSNIGQRLMRVRKYVENDEAFLANYSDGISDLPLDKLVADFHQRKVVASFASVHSAQTFHTRCSGDDGLVSAMRALNESKIWINGGFFALRREIFDYMNEGEELVVMFERLIKEAARDVSLRGFWHAMDTFKDKITLDRLEAQGNCPWMVWKTGNGG